VYIWCKIFYKMGTKWPLGLQVKMIGSLLKGLVTGGFAYGCALGTLTGVEAGYTHTVADMTCSQVDVGMVSQVGSTVACLCDMGRPEVAAACSFAAMLAHNVKAVKAITCKMVDQGQFKQAVACSYETVLLGARCNRPDIIANQTVQVARAGQRYVNLLADVVAALVTDGFGEEAARVCLLVIQRGHLRIAWRICNTMVRRGNGRQAAKVSRCLVAAGHEDFKSCLTGEHTKCKSAKGDHHLPTWCHGIRHGLQIACTAGLVVGAIWLGQHRHSLHLLGHDDHEAHAKAKLQKRKAAQHLDTDAYSDDEGVSEAQEL
jgi:hypothetical protein